MAEKLLLAADSSSLTRFAGGTEVLSAVGAVCDLGGDEGAPWGGML